MSWSNYSLFNQNSALCRRLSARYSQIIDADLSKIGAAGNTAKATEGERPSYRRAKSSAPGLNSQHQLRSQRSLEADRLRRRSQSSTRSGMGEQRDARHVHGYAYGTQLPPIPASPYATESSSPPSPDSKRASRSPLSNGGAKRDSPIGKQKTDEEGSKSQERGKEKDGLQMNGGEVTPPRNRSKSSSFVPYRSPQPQSLDAAAELLAHYPNGQGAQPPSTAPAARKQATSSTTPASAPSSPSDPNMSFSPQASSSPARGKDNSSGSDERPSFSMSISVDKGPISLPGLTSPHGNKFGSLGFSKGKEKANGLSALSGFGVPQLPRRSLSSPPEHVAQISLPAPSMGRRSTNGVHPVLIRTQDIGAPVLDTRAYIHF